MNAGLKSACHSFKFKVNTLNLFLPIQKNKTKQTKKPQNTQTNNNNNNNKKLGKFETETPGFETRMLIIKADRLFKYISTCQT